MTTDAKHALKEFAYVNNFKCLADKCEDQCCSVWRVSINDEVIERYKASAPELYEQIVRDDNGPKFSLVPGTKACVNLEKNLCSVQGKYGSDFLPNTCYFFPRNMRYVGDNIMVAATISCPEIARLVLYSDDPFKIVDGTESRIPDYISNTTPDRVSEEEFILVMQRFLRETEREDIDAEAIMIRLVIVSKMLDDYEIVTWHTVIDKLFELADFQHIPEPKAKFRQFDLLRYISELKAPGVVRFDEAYNAAQSIFQAYVNRNTNELEAGISPFIMEAYEGRANAKINQVLKRFIASEMARTLFPYAWCDSDNPFEKAAIIAINFAMARLCLLGKIDADGNAPEEDEVVRSIQGIFRSQNHLTLNKVDFYNEKGLVDLGMLMQVIFLP